MLPQSDGRFAPPLAKRSIQNVETKLPPYSQNQGLTKEPLILSVHLRVRQAVFNSLPLSDSSPHMGIFDFENYYHFFLDKNLRGAYLH
jgi:hypothetical protein